ncbi:MAG: carboxylating nicotinate-nucleotide diphosphorylase [Lentimicrobiaceae bacterium]|nr:carboxylating nicotinate-nucleotide diphosphorylase [Lentimicrobiaceae bacterium]MCL2132464.1 carboxylating nicotinate-nucleotide diphosphorylase [Lentimicrobiaceae bacterium]
MTIEKIIEEALKEDIGTGDYSSLLSVDATARGEAKLIAKDNGIAAGMDIAMRVFKQIDENLSVESCVQDGTAVQKGLVLMKVSGSIRSILGAERLVLNIMQRMSGIATVTNRYCQLIKGTHAKLLDTRKTTPNLRILEKMAVRIGGGYNHRMGLYDMIMLKDNHIDFAGGIENAVKKANEYKTMNRLALAVEIETRSLSDVEKVMQLGGVNRIMFDNFSVEDVRKGVALVNGCFETEASGNINEQTIRPYAETGVDFISVGALTHSVKSLDISLLAVKKD